MRKSVVAISFIVMILTAFSAVLALQPRGDGPPERQREDRPSTQRDDPPRVIDSSSEVRTMSGVGPAFTTMSVPSTGCSSRSITSSDPGCGTSCSDARCATVCVSGIPVGSTITAINAYARESNGGWRKAWKHSAGFYDVLEYSRWYPGPTSTTEQNKMKVCWTYRNWSHNLGREAKLEVVFTPPK